MLSTHTRVHIHTLYTQSTPSTCITHFWNVQPLYTYIYIYMYSHSSSSLFCSLTISTTLLISSAVRSCAMHVDTKLCTYHTHMSPQGLSIYVCMYFEITCTCTFAHIYMYTHHVHVHVPCTHSSGVKFCLSTAYTHLYICHNTQDKN